MVLWVMMQESAFILWNYMRSNYLVHWDLVQTDNIELCAVFRTLTSLSPTAQIRIKSWVPFILNIKVKNGNSSGTGYETKITRVP